MSAKANLIKLLAMRSSRWPRIRWRRSALERHTAWPPASSKRSPSRCVKVYIDAKRLTSPGEAASVHGARSTGASSLARATSTKGSAIDVLPTVNADVVYLDPPYPGTTPYEREYRILDEIFDGEAKPVSRFSESVDLLDALFDSAVHIPVWLLSYGNAELSGADLEDRVAACGRETRLIEVPYAHKASASPAPRPAPATANSWSSPSTLSTASSSVSARGGLSMPSSPSTVPETRVVPIADLVPHPMNANQMPPDLFEKLRRVTCAATDAIPP